MTNKFKFKIGDAVTYDHYGTQVVWLGQATGIGIILSADQEISIYWVDNAVPEYVGAVCLYDIRAGTGGFRLI